MARLRHRPAGGQPAVSEVLSALGVSDDVTSNFNVLPLLGLPVTVGFAVLHYRLYDIDRIINRTLSTAC